VEPFRVNCETCHSRLKVRSPEVIGQIHECPKCGSMVHILPPTGWVPDGALQANGEAGVSTAPALTVSSTISTIIPASVAASLAALQEAPAATASTASPAPMPVSAPTRTFSRTVVWAAGIGSVLVIGGLAVALWISRGDKAANPPRPVSAPQPISPASTPQEIVPVPTANVPEAATADIRAADHSQDTPPSSPAVSETVATESPPKPVDKAAAPEPPVAPVKNELTSPKDHSIATKPADPPSANAIQAPAATPSSENAAKRQPVLKFDPLDFDPDRFSLGASSPADPAPATSSVTNETPPVVARGDAAPAAANAPNAQVPATKDFASPAANPSITVRRGPTPVAVTRPHGANPLAIRIKSLQVTEAPLARFVETASELAGVGITLDPLALALAGVSPRAAVTVDAADTALEKILRDALSKHRLEMAEADGQVQVALPNAAQVAATDYPVDDLAGAADAGPFAKLIEQFVAPAEWQPAGAGKIEANGKTLHIENTVAARRQVFVFCERLRLARRLSIRSKYPQELLSIESPYNKLAAKLRQHTTFTFMAWTRLADVVRQWQEMSGLTILVDWSALCSAECSPASPIACSAIDRPWEEAFDGVLEPIGLGWWALDGQTIQITSLEALERIQRIEFYEVPKQLRNQFATTPALIDALQNELKDHGGKHGKVDAPQLAFDEPSGRLIVLASPESHRFLTKRLHAKN
jgi:hypothetical protein